ncbi:hypothetical protein KYG_09215 [Acidovorax sp. NO-1]|nr:hypothetical protein KYG_09215 [Acidovorax sp. NO-1]
MLAFVPIQASPRIGHVVHVFIILIVVSVLMPRVHAGSALDQKTQRQVGAPLALLSCLLQGLAHEGAI